MSSANLFEQAANTAGASLEDVEKTVGALDYINPGILAQMMVNKQVEIIEFDDFVPEDRDWLLAFVRSDAYKSLYRKLFSECGAKRTLEIIYETKANEDSDLYYYEYLTNEDPEMIAAAFATEALDRYVEG